MASACCVGGVGVTCVKKLMTAITKDYEQCEDTVDGHLMSDQIGYSRDLKFTYSHGNVGVYISTSCHLEDKTSVYIDLTQYLILLSLREEIDEALCQVQQHLQFGPSCGEYVRHLGGDLLVKINKHTGNVEIGQYMKGHQKLSSICGCLVMCPVEWLFLNTTYKRLCMIVPQIIKMKHCIDNHNPL
jgi:hypothetical protein